MNQSHTNQAPLLLLTWGTGNEARAARAARVQSLQARHGARLRVGLALLAPATANDKAIAAAVAWVAPTSARPALLGLPVALGTSDVPRDHTGAPVATLPAIRLRGGTAKARAARQAAEVSALRAEAAEVRASTQAATRAANRRRAEVSALRAASGDGLTEAARAFTQGQAIAAATLDTHGDTRTRLALEHLPAPVSEAEAEAIAAGVLDVCDAAPVGAKERRAMRRAKRAARRIADASGATAAAIVDAPAVRLGAALGAAREGALAIARRCLLSVDGKPAADVSPLAVDRLEPLAHRPSFVMVAALDYVAASEHLTRLSLASARAFARKLEQSGGRTVDATTEQEFANIMRAAFARALTGSGLVPSDFAAFRIGRDNALPFRALLVWKRQHARALRACRSYVWGKGWERCEVVTLADLGELQRAVMHAPEPHAATRAATIAAAFTERAVCSPRLKRRVRLLTARWADYLRAFWALSGSRKWRAGLASDLRLLRCAAEVTRGGELAALPVEWQTVGDWRDMDGTRGGEAPTALRCAKSDWLKHVASGAVLTMEQTEAVESALAIMRDGRAARVTGATARKRTAEAATFSAEAWAAATVCAARAATLGADVCATLHGVSA